MRISIEMAMPEKDSKYFRPWRNVIVCTLGTLCMYILGVAGFWVVKLAIAFPNAIVSMLIVSGLLIAAAIRAVSEYLLLTTRKDSDFTSVCLDVCTVVLLASLGAAALQIIMFFTTWPTLLFWYAVSMAAVFAFSMPSWFNTQAKV